MTNPDAYAAAALDMLQAGAPLADIAEQTGLSRGEIAALAEANGLTAAHARRATQDLLDALAWGEAHDTKKAQNLAARARSALTQLSQLRTAEQQRAEAEAEVAAAKAQLAAAEGKLRAARTGKPSPAVPTVSRPAARERKEDREKIRAWARRHGHQVADRGAISQTLRDAYARRDAA